MMERRPNWMLMALTRHSLRRAFALLQNHQAQRRAEALVTARAIHLVQDQAKAMRCFLILSGCSALVAVGYGWIDEPVTGALWACTSPLLMLNAEKARRSRIRATETIALYRQDSGLPTGTQ